MAENTSLGKFGLIFVGQAFSLLGSRLVQFTLVWWLTAISGKASVLAFASIMAMVPQIILGPIAGVYVDRWNRKTVMMVADVLIACGILVLAGLFYFGLIEIWHVYLIMFLRSVGDAFHFPAMQASTTLLVPKKYLTRVSGLTQSLQGITSIVAPVLGAIFLEIVDIQIILGIDVVTAVLAILPLLLTHIPQPLRVKQEHEENPMTDFREILDFVLEWRGGLIIILGSMLGNLLLTPAFALLPLLITDYFSVGVAELALVQSGWGLGMVLGGALLGVWGGFKKKIVTAMSATLVQGLCLSVISMIPSNAFQLAIVVFFISGLLNPIVNGSLISIVQTVVPPELQGRYFTVIMSGTGAMTPIGLALAGPISDMLGIKIWFTLGGVCFFILGLSAFFIKPIMEIENAS
jgi:DHA3 family macrolide efflux protein-like MFS transporter